jgi:hypothetical protein
MPILFRIHEHISERTSVVLGHVSTITGLSNIRKAIHQRLKDELVTIYIIDSPEGALIEIYLGSSQTCNSIMDVS